MRPHSALPIPTFARKRPPPIPSPHGRRVPSIRCRYRSLRPASADRSRRAPPRSDQTQSSAFEIPGLDTDRSIHPPTHHDRQRQSFSWISPAFALIATYRSIPGVRRYADRQTKQCNSAQKSSGTGHLVCSIERPICRCPFNKFDRFWQHYAWALR